MGCHDANSYGALALHSGQCFPANYKPLKAQHMYLELYNSALLRRALDSGGRGKPSASHPGRTNTHTLLLTKFWNPKVLLPPPPPSLVSVRLQ